MCQQYLLFAEGELLYISTAVILYVCVVTYIRVVFSRLDKHPEMTDLYCGAAVGVWHSKDQFQTVNKAWTRNTSQQNVTRPPFSTPPCSPSPPLCSALSSPVDVQRIVVPLFQFADHVTSFHNVLPPGGSRLGRSSGPGQVRREPITFQCCFSTLCKEQSVLISVDYRRMLIQCHADRLQRENESISRFRPDSPMSPADKEL